MGGGPPSKYNRLRAPGGRSSEVQKTVQGNLERNALEQVGVERSNENSKLPQAEMKTDESTVDLKTHRVEEKDTDEQIEGGDISLECLANGQARKAPFKQEEGARSILQSSICEESKVGAKLADTSNDRECGAVQETCSVCERGATSSDLCERVNENVYQPCRKSTPGAGQSRTRARDGGNGHEQGDKVEGGLKKDRSRTRSPLPRPGRKSMRSGKKSTVNDEHTYRRDCWTSQDSTRSRLRQLKQRTRYSRSRPPSPHRKNRRARDKSSRLYDVSREGTK